MPREMLIIGVGAVAALVVGASLYALGNYSYGGSNGLAAVAVPVTKLAAGKQSAVGRRVNYLITTQGQLAELWGFVSSSTAPLIDFSKNEVIAVFSGSVSDVAITVTQVEDAKTRTVSIDINRLSGSCVRKSGPAPYEIVSVPATSLPLEHKDVIKTSPCN